MLDLIQVTAQYSNAVLVVLLPHFSDVAHKLDLPIPTPITMSQVSRLRCDPRDGNVGGWLTLTNGYEFWFMHGFTSSYQSPNSYYHLQDPDKVPSLYGRVKIGRREAEKIARNGLKKLGYSEDSLFVDPTPKITMPEANGDKTIPRYRFEWIDPSFGGTSADVEVNAENKRIEMVTLTSRNLWKPSPKLNMPEMTPSVRHQGKDPNEATISAKDLETCIGHITEFVQNLSLHMPVPLTTNQVSKIDYRNEAEEITVRLANGYSFRLSGGYVNGFSAPDCFFDWQPPAHLKDYEGKWRMSNEQAIELARKTLGRLGYFKDGVGKNSIPDIRKPEVVGKMKIPRLLLTWKVGKNMELDFLAEVEIDAEKKTVKSLYILDPKRMMRTGSLETSPNGPRPMRTVTNAPMPMRLGTPTNQQQKLGTQLTPKK